VTKVTNIHETFSAGLNELVDKAHTALYRGLEQLEDLKRVTKHYIYM
jgi:hypothetical protein